MSEITQLEDVRKRVDAEVKENFGYAPDSKYFNDLVDEMRNLEFKVKVMHPAYYLEYANKHY